MTEENGAMYVSLIFYLDSNYNYVSEVIAVKLTRASSVKNAGAFHTTAQYFIFTIIFRRLSRSRLLSHPSVHRHLFGIKRTC